MTEILHRPRVPVSTLPPGIPSVPTFDGESSLSVASSANSFLKDFASSIQSQDWETFSTYFNGSNSWWKDSLTLTFDKRTLHGQHTITDAFKTLCRTRKPHNFSTEKIGVMDMEAAWIRMAPNLASLDVPFSFETEGPRSKCIGVLKLIPVDGKWKIWVMATAVMELLDHPFHSLPRTSPSMIEVSQRGKPNAQGLPRVDGVLDAVIVGASCNGIANTIMLDSIGANVAAFDMEPVAGGNWSTKRYENVTLHHSNFMIQLPMFPVPEGKGYPNFLTGSDVTKYYGAAIEEYKLPVFASVKVLSNTFDLEKKIWDVVIQDVESGKKASIQAKNIVISTGFIVSPDNPKYPPMKDQDLFKGPIEHTITYRTPAKYANKDVLIVGSGNSAHDVANNLALSAAKSVTILQRSPTVLLDFEVIAPMLFMRYTGDIPVDTADFLQTCLPAAIERDLARGGIAAMIAGQEERNKAFESKGYMLDKTPCLISRAYEERGRAFYMDQPGTFDLVFKDRIKIARGELKGFVEDGVVVKNVGSEGERVIEAGGVVLATGYEIVDLPRKWKESGFLDEKSASMIENVSLFGLDGEGEVPGYVTASGHPHLYFSGIGLYMCRWVGRYTAIQVMADVNGKFPETYTRK